MRPDERAHGDPRRLEGSAARLMAEQPANRSGRKLPLDALGSRLTWTPWRPSERRSRNDRRTHTERERNDSRHHQQPHLTHATATADGRQPRPRDNLVPILSPGREGPLPERAYDRDESFIALGPELSPKPALYNRSSSYFTSVSILNIGMYIAMMITPTIRPTPIIMSGSMIEVSDATDASTSSS